MLLPHEYMAALVENGYFTTTTAEIREWWAHMASTTEWARHHPGNDVCVPLGLFGDAARYSKNDKFFAMFWNNILHRTGHSLDRSFPIVVIRHERMIKSVTLAPVLKALAWSFNVLLEGRWPSHGPRGDLLTGWRAERAGLSLGVHAALVEMRGDWEYHVYLHNLKCYWRTHEMCHMCCATQESCSEFSEAASWRPTMRSHEQFVASVLPTNPNALWDIVGIDCAMMRWCTMHVMNLGICQDMAASALLFLVESFPGFFTGNDLDERLSSVWESFKEWARRNQIQVSQPRFSTQTLKVAVSEYPSLSGKAYNTRVVCAYLAATFVHLLSFLPQSEESELQMGCTTCWAMNEFFLQMEKSTRFISNLEGGNLVKFTKIGLATYKKLAVVNAGRSVLRWALKPKHHAWLHVAEIAAKAILCLCNQRALVSCVVNAKHKLCKSRTW